MNNTITLTSEQMQALQSGQSITINPPEVEAEIKQWSPSGGDWYICSNLTETYNSNSSDVYRESGLEYSTKDKAEEARKLIRAYARQLKWLSENSDGWTANWSDAEQEKYYIIYIKKENMYKKLHVVYIKSINTIYMSKDNAEKLARLLNEGVVEF